MTSGPLPSSEQMEQYEAILPGAADRILKMTEAQAIHRQTLEKAAIKSDIIDSKLGILCAFLLGAATVTAGAIVILNGYEWSGTLLGTSGLAGLASVFVYGTRSSRKERAEKENEINK